MSGLTTGKDGHHLKRRSRRSAVHAVDQERHRRRQTLTRSLLILFLLFALAGLAFLRIAGFERTALEPYRATTNDSKRKGSNKSERMIKEQTKTSKNIKVRNRTKEKDSLSSFLRKGDDKDGGEMLDVSYHGNSKKPFCLDWSINSDDWWTHHPDWEVFNETENSYCFHVISNVEKATLYRSIYVSQFPSRPKSCQKAVSAHMWNSGFGADFDNLVDKLRFAHRKRGVPFVVRTHPDNGWHYAYPKHKPKGKNVRRADPVCDTKDMFCYFLPFTNCTSEESTVPTTTEPFLWQSNFYLWEANQRIYWYFQYLVGRQQTWLRRRIYDFVLFYQAKFDLGSKPCTVFHVRRSDVVLHEDDSRRYHAISEYMNAVDLFRDDKDNRTFPIHKNIFLLTDDANAIDEAKEQYPNHHWMYVDRKRFRADEGGWENQIPSNDPALEIVILLGTFRLIQQCQSFVHTESNLGKLLAAELKHSVDPSFPTLNLDYGKGFDEVFSKDHQSTVHLSTSWKNVSEKILPAKDVERISGKTTSTTQKDAKPEGIIEPSPSDTNVEEIVKPLSYVVKKEMRNVTNKGENEFDTFRGYLDVSYRSDGSTKPFCLPWHVNSDKWWTHHPDWRVTKETEDHYCFRHMRDKSEAKFHTDLYNNQFEGNCSNVLVKKMWSSGFGADMMNLMDGLRYGHVSGIPFQVYTEDFGWHYAAPKTAGRLDENVKPADPLCPSKDMFCFFLPISNCPSRKRLDDQYYFEPIKWNDKDNHMAFKYLTRPQTWLRHRITKFVQSHTLTQPCTVMHVRRSDVVLHGSQSRRYHSIAEYVNASSAGFPVHDNILILSDDANAIDEAFAEFPQYNWMFINRTRYRGAEGGWENQLPSNDPAYEMVVLLGTFELIKQCQSFVRTVSGIADIFESELKSTDEDFPVINLDEGRDDVWSEENRESVVVSEAWQKKSGTPSG